MKIGIRNEDKYETERRTALVPFHVDQLINNTESKVYVESSPKRVFSDEEYRQNGAIITNELTACELILGIKEVPIHKIEEDKIYMTFSHVVKGQKKNMPALKKMMESRATLMDYERIVDSDGKRLIFFGRYAGLAGMINGLWALGKRLEYFGIQTPFVRMQQAISYGSLDHAIQAVREVGELILQGAIEEMGFPLVIGITGYGNVSKGALEVLDLLPVVEISPSRLISLQNEPDWDKNKIYKVIFREKDLVKPVDPYQDFSLEDYYHHPEKYSSDFDQYISRMTMLVNGMYWDEKYPRLVTKNYLKKHYTRNHPLKVIIDISCDLDGSIECTGFYTRIDQPVFAYDPASDSSVLDWESPGLLVMAEDILPSELPGDSSVGFSQVLYPLLKDIIKADFSVPFHQLELPAPVKKAVILYKGALTPDYIYLEKFLI